MECSRCGVTNRASARFCGGCGSPLARRCPGCDAELDGTLAFCDQCGTALDAAPVATAPPATPVTGAVRKTVTVLFADLGGSTGFGERTDPEVSRQVLARYHALLQETIDTHGGTVAKFMGDGMMATFGIPEIAEDDARRAVLAGVDIQRRFESFAADVVSRYGETLTLRVGINTGEVVIAAGDADLVGDALNVAARLEKACRPGHVLVGDETWRITRGELAYEPLGEVTVAGRTGPVGTYEVVATGATTAEPVAPFVGRVGETARLLAAFDQARADSAAVLVTVLGSPGMGKTRLSRELASALDADERAHTYEIRCDRSGGATFAPFADLIGTAAGIGDETDDGVDARERIAALVTDDADRARVVDVVAGLLGAAPARSVEETFWAIRRIVESLATARPLVVVIDDIQWAEPKLLDLLEHLAEWVHGAAVLLVCLARPELRDLRPALTEPGRRVADVLALDGLDASATAELAAGLLGSALPAELVDRLPSSTDGNPLFVRELVRMLVDDAVIRSRDDGTWELAIDADAIEVPPTIQSLLATRVERLPAVELRILELASVVGAEFSVGAIRELADEPATVSSVLERLRRKELVEPTGSYWGDDPLHRFHHVLIRDAAYRRLLKTTRAELHRRVGEWTDSIAADLVGEQETAIAFHYEQAHRYRIELGTTDDDTDRLGRRAAELLSVAARRSLDREDLTSAGALARRALAALPDEDVDDRAGLLLIACECFLSSGDVGAGAPLVDALTALAGDNEQLGGWAACYRAQLVGLTDPDGVVAAEEMATAAAATLARLDDGAGEAKAHQVRAGLLARLGRVGEAEVVLDLALGAARASDDRRRVTAVLGAAPQAALFGPSPVARAGGRCLDVVRLLRITTASPSVEATSMRCQAVLEALRGRFDVSRSMLASARASLEELGLRHGLLETDLFTGMVELIAADPGAAIDPLRSAYEGLGTLGVGADAGQAAALLAMALLACGEIDEAELMAGESEALAGQNLKTAIAWRSARAQVLAARGDLVAGTALAAEAVDIAAATDLVLDHADVCVVLADLRGLSGDARGAEQARTDARRLYEAKGASVPAARLARSSIASTEAPSRERAPSASTLGAERRTAACENTATRIVARLTSFIGSGQDPPADLVSPSLELQDRRSIVGLATADATAIGENFAIMRNQGYDIVPLQPLAVRGERLALHRTRARTPAGDETVLLSVDEVDDAGRVCRLVWFDDDDIAAALTELDERYLAGEGAPNAEVLETARRLDEVGADLDALEGLLAEDFEAADHRLLAFGAGDRDHFLETSRTNTDVGLTPIRSINRVVHVSGRAVLAVRTERRSTADGVVYEWPGCDLVVIDGDGRASRLETFDLDDFAAALARLDELGTEGSADPRTAEVENTATRVHALVCAAIITRRADDLRPLITRDFVQEDRRPLVSLPTLDRHGLTENFAVMHEQGYVTMEPQAIAVRGERLCLDLVTARTEAGDETALLAVVELDEERRECRNVVFDAEDLVAAMAELDRAYFLGEGVPFQRVLGAVGRYTAAYGARDVDGVRDQLAPDLVVVDHQPLGFGTGDRDYLVEMGRTDRSEGRGVNSVLHVNEHALLTVYSQTPISTTGSRYERSGIVVMRIDASDRFDRIEMFADEDFDAALACFDELGARTAVDRHTIRIENAATRADARAARFLARPDHETPADLALADGFMLEDRRTVVALPDLDAGGLAENFAAMREQGYTIQTPEPLAVRGDSLCLSRRVATTVGGDESPVLAITELDEQGRYRSLVFFDADDLAAALNELDHRYLAGEGAQHTRVLRVGKAFGDANERRDFDAMRDMLSADFVMSDRTRLGYGVGDREYFDAASRTRADVAPSDGIAINRLLRIDGDALLTVAEGHHITAEGSDYAWVSCIVFQVDADDRIRRAEYFDEDDFGAALDRLHELADAGPADGHTELQNRATRVHTQVLAAIDAGDVEAQRALATRDFALDDRRAVVGVPDQDARGITRYHEIMLEQGYEILPPEPLAVRGEHLTLSRVTHRTADGNESILLALIELNDHGLIARASAFDEDDLPVALVELDQRYAESPAVRRSSGAENVTTRLMIRSGELATAHRFDLLRELLADDFVRADHRTGVSAPVANGPDEFVTAYAAWFEVGFDQLSITPLAIRGDRLALTRLEWSSADGRTVGFLGVYETNVDGGFVRGAHFDEDDLDAAFAELDERFLAGDGAEHLAVLAAGQAWIEASRAEDVDALRAVTAPGLVCVDHSPLGFGTLDREGLLAATRLRFELSADDVVIVRSVQVAGSAALAVHYAETTTDDGSRYERAACYLLRVDDAGLIDRWEVFGEDEYDRALDRLRALGSTEVAAAPDTVENPVTRLLARLLDLMNRRENEAAYALDAVAADVVRFDRRHTVSAPTLVGGGGFVENARAIYQVFGVVHPEPIAVRGDRLALIRLHCGEADGFTLQLLIIYELDTDGRICWEADYDEDQLDDALTELDERYLLGEGAEHEYLVRRLGDFRTAQSNRDWDAIEDLVADEFRFSDHRPMGLPEADRAGYVDVMRASEEQTPGVRLIHRSLDVRSSVVLARTGRVGATPDGLEYEWEQIAVMVWAAGLLRRVELFAVPDWTAAQVRFEELANASRLTPYVDSRLVRITQRIRWLGRHDEARPLVSWLADGCVLDDRRVGVNAGAVTGDVAVQASIQSGIDVFGVLDLEPLAVRGDRLALYRWAFVTDAGFEAPGLCVIEAGDDDRTQRITSFDEADLAIAVDFLETRHRELAGDRYTWIERIAAEGERALNHRAFDAFAPLLAPEFAIVDHRQLGVPMDRTEYLESLRVLIEQAPDFRFFFAKPRVEGNIAITPVPFFGTTPEGSRYEWSYVQVAVADTEGRAVAFEFFDDDQWDDAVARFEELTAETTAPVGRGPSIENMASRLTAEAARGFGVEGGQGSEHRADDLVRVDHRRMIGGPTTTTRDEFADAARAFGDVGMTDLAFDVLAVRGDRCCLGRLTYSGADFDVSFLTVVGCNERNQMAWIDNFDEDDHATAYATLDERFIAGEGAEHASMIRRSGDFGNAYRDRDWTALQEVFAPDATLVDHRSIGQGWNDRSDFVASSRAAVELTTDVRHVVHRLEVRGGTSLADGEASGTTTDGSRYSWGYQLVAQWVGGRVTRFEIFDATDAVVARGRFEELAPELGTPHVDNDAVWVLERFSWFGGREDLEGARALLAPDLLAIDRRPGVAAPDMVGPDARLANLAAVGEVFDRIDSSAVAVRGNRLVLIGWTVSADGFATSGYDVTEIDAEGRIARIVTFDEEGLVGAVEELDARHRELAGGDLLPAEALALRGIGAVNRRDWSALADCLAAGFVSIDHTPLGFGPADANRFISEQLQSLVALVSDLVVVPVKHVAHGSVCLTVNRAIGTSQEGNRYEWNHFIVAQMDAGGRTSRQEFFAEDDWAGAAALFDAWTVGAGRPAADDPGVFLPDITNAAVRTLVRGGELMMTDIEAALDLFAEGASSESHQSGPMRGASAFGRDDWRNALTSWADTYDALRFEPVAVRGDRVALLRYVFEADGFLSPALVVVDLDAEGRIQTLQSFDDGDLDAALDVLRDRYVMGEGAVDAYRLLRIGDLRAARRDQDWVAYADLFDSRFEGVDRRSLSLPVTDGPSFVAAQREMAVLAPDSVFVHAWQRIAGDVVLALVEIDGESPEGNAYQWSHFVIWQMAAGRWIRCEFFSLDDLPGAERRLDELAAEPRTPYVDNDAVRTLVRLEWLQRAGRRSDVAQLVADDIVILDRRRGVSAPDLVGPASFAASIDASEDLFGSVGLTDFVAVRGSRLALTRWTMAADNGFETRGCDVVEVDDEGRLCRFVTFDESRFADAVDEMEHRHHELRGDEYTLLDGLLAEGEHALNRRDLARLNAMLAPEFFIEDHQQFGVPMTRASSLDNMRVLVEQAPDVAFVFAKPHVVGDVFLTPVPYMGATPDGSRYEWSFFQLGRVDGDGRATRFEMFPDDGWADALARFDEWAAEPDAPAALPLAGLAGSVSAAFAARDWEWIRGRIASDAELEDRRSTVSSHAVVGSDALVDLFRGFADVGFETLDNVHVASRGDGLVLLRRVYQAPGGFELQMLAVVETNAEGLMAALVLFDVDDMVPALDEMEIRYARSGLLTPDERQIVLAFVAVNHRAWHELDAVLAPDLHVVDHRRIGFPAAVGSEPLVHALQDLVEQVPDLVVVIERIESAGRAILAVNHQVGTSADGVVVDWQWYLVFAFDGDGRIALMEYFDCDSDEARARARTRYEELAGRDA